MWVPFLCCWFVELFLTFVLCWFFSVPVNRKVPDWLPLRLVSLIYPKNGNNTEGEGTGHVWVQHISLTYSGRILPRHREGIVSGNAGHLLWWRADKTFCHHQALQCFASTKPQTSILSLGKTAVFFSLPPLPVNIPSFKVKFNCLFPQETFRKLTWMWLPLHISIARSSAACHTCHGLLDIGSCHNHCEKHGWWLVHFLLSHKSRLLYWTKSRPLESAK